MASKSTKDTEDQITVSSLKHQESTDVQGSPKKKGEVTISHSADPCNDMHVAVSARKRMAAGDGDIPQKRMRCSDIISPVHGEASLADTRIQTGKRKANVDVSSPNKKTRCSINTQASDPSKVSGADCLVRSGKRKADQDGETPKKRQRCDSANVSESSTEEKKDESADDDGDDISQEEKIYRLSSSGSTSNTDFEDKYCQLEAIGAGGFGSVYGGFRKADGLPVAIKHVPSRGVRREKVTCNGKVYNVLLEVALMLKSAGLPGSVGQSTAVSLLDWYILKEELILVMEKPDGCKDLYVYRRDRGGCLSENEAKMILRQMVDAAIDMHSKGVFHQDIKLRNVLVEGSSSEPRVRVIDFGCGSFSKEETYFSFSGTFAYAPPEWFDNQSYWAKSTTVWQLGVLFYSLLNGHRPFSTPDFMQHFIRINSALSKEVKTLLFMCLAINPKERATLEELQLHPALRLPSPPPTQGHL